MKTQTLVSVLILFAMAPQVALAQPSSTESVLLMSAPPDEQSTNKLINLFTSSTAYGIAVNGIRNGSGNQASPGSKLKTAGPLEQALRTLSLFDLYFTYGVRTMGITTNLQYVLTPLKSSAINQFKPYRLDYIEKTVNGILGPSVPLIDNHVRTLHDSGESDPVIVNESRTGLSEALAERFPQVRLPSDPSSRLLVMMKSFQPILVKGALNINKNNLSASHAASAFYFPALGEPVFPKTSNERLDVRNWSIKPIESALKEPMVTPYAKIDRLSYGASGKLSANRVIRVQTEKSFGDPDTIKLVASFGRLLKSEETKNKIVGEMDVDLNRSDILNHDDGLIAKGSLIIDKKYTGPIWSSVRSILKNFKIEVGIHRMALQLKRPTFADATQAFEKDSSFQTIESLLDENILTFRIIVDPSTLPSNIISRTFSNGDGVLASIVRAYFSAGAGRNGSNDGCPDRSQSLTLTGERECRKTFYGVKEFNDNFIEGFINKNVMKFVNAGAGQAINDNVDQIRKGFDPALKKAISEALSSLQFNRELIEQGFKTISAQQKLLGK